MADTSFFEILKIKDDEKPTPSKDEQLTNLLEQNNLIKKKLPTGPNSLLRAISDTLYFTSHYADEIQQFLFKHLTHLIVADKLPAKLSTLRGNSMLLKDYTSNPRLPGFDKINLELVSSLFKIKIVVYSVTEDNYLSSIIVNNYYERTIEIARNKNNHYEAVFTKRYMDKIGFAQNIILNIVDNVITNKPTDDKRNFNNDSYMNFNYLKWLATNEQNNNLSQFKITRGVHKKSLSDNFNKYFESKEDQPFRLYDLFTNTKPPEDFLKFVKQRKDTAGSDFSINATFDFMDEPWNETPSISQTSQVTLASNRQRQIYFPRESETTYSHLSEHRSSIYPSQTFSQRIPETVNISEIEKIETTPKNSASMLSPIHYINTPPPGLTPSRYFQKSFTYSESQFSNADVSPMANFQRSEFGQAIKSGYSPSPSGRMGFGNFSQAQQGAHTPNSLYSKRTGNSENLILPIPTSEQGYAQTGDDMGQLSASKEKKKPIILDESKERHTGRLKFFDENKNYGFIVMDDDGSDIFVHLDDLMKANISKDMLKTIKIGNMLRLSFCCMMYIGKYKKSRKATDITILNE